ncbi:lasso RiPP family leader peptide-containing protein [Actinokineospora sp. 24-640]
MRNENIDNENTKAVYEPPTFEEAGSFRDSTGFVVVIKGDPNSPGWF